MNNHRAAPTQARRQPGPQRLVRTLNRLGPTFVKIGQFLALRPDILPQEYCDELLRLVDRVPPSPWDDIRAILTAELGDAPENVFARISTRPLAAGSIAQVHAAETRDGQRVAVKVQRPDLPQRVERDLRRARALARFVNVFGLLPGVSAGEVIDEIERWLRQELDFTRELNNQLRMYELAAQLDALRVPRPLPSLSSRRVLTAEYLQGVPFSDLLRLAGSGAGARIRALGYDRDRLATNLIEIALHQIFRLRFFHADVHPGNLLAIRGDLIGLVDFGLTDVLDPSVEGRQAEYLGAVYKHDVPSMYRALSQMLVESPDTDPEAFRRDFMAETNQWLARLDAPGERGGGRSPIAEYMVTLMRLARSHGMRLPPSVLSMYRTLLTAESVAQHLQSEANLRTLGRRFFTDLQLERTIEQFGPQRITTWLMELNELTRTAPSHVQQLLTELADGRFVLSVRSAESEAARRSADRRARLLALSIVSVGLAVLATAAGAWGQAAERLVWAMLLGVYLWIVIMWRRPS